MIGPSTDGTGSAGVAGSARGLLRGRVLAQVGVKEAESLAATVPMPFGGLVVTGSRTIAALARLRRAHPELVLAAEPDADAAWVATPDAPFVLGQDDLWRPASLERSLDQQREAGASFALAPSGHVQAGDAPSLRAIIELANRLDRDDMVVRVPLHAAWVRKDAIRQLEAALRRSRHPVALSLAAPKDPLEGRGIAAAVQDLAAAVPHMLLWRTDLAALAHVSAGGLAGAIGFTPALRHGALPGRKGFALDPTDKRPHVLLPGWLRFMRGTKLEDVFASALAPVCDCRICHGAPLDRFGSSDIDRLRAHQHNVAVWSDLAAQLRAVPAAGRPAWWRAQLEEAVRRHDEASAVTGRDVAVPGVLEAWVRVATRVA